MNLRKLWPLLAALIVSAAAAQEEDPCTLPGVLVFEDAAGDHQLAPTGEGYADILSLHMAEPASMPGRLVFTYKMSDLSNVPPDALWMIRFSTDVPPANGEEQSFVAMLTEPDTATHFIHGTANNVEGQGLRVFTPAGTLDAPSNFNADGTITLVLDKSAIPGLDPGGVVFGMIPYTHVTTPTDGSLPFTHGFRTVGAVQFSLDEGTDGFYEVVGNESCGEGKSGILGIGALSPAWLLPLLLLAALRRQLAASRGR